jgi:hypothetical protein
MRISVGLGFVIASMALVQQALAVDPELAATLADLSARIDAQQNNSDHIWTMTARPWY